MNIKDKKLCHFAITAVLLTVPNCLFVETMKERDKKDLSHCAQNPLILLLN